MIIRPAYLEKLRPFIDKPLVKVLTGMRRSGKSTVLEMIHEDLLACGVSKERVIEINFESMSHAGLDSAQNLYTYVKERVQPGIRTYLLLDEIQEVENWEKAVNSFLVDFDCDIYLTGSNSRLLSGELATYLAGRYVEFPVFTLSFSEMLEFDAGRAVDTQIDRAEAFLRYLRLGGFPVLHIAEYAQADAYRIINDIYASAILRDVIQRHKIRNIALLEKILHYVMDNTGNLFSAKKVSDYFKSQLRKVDIETVYGYLAALEQAFIIHKVPRYDIKGKEVLTINEKYYLGDPGIKYALLGYRDRDIGGMLENMVYLELKRRAYKVYVGVAGDREIDFIAIRQDEKIYIQVAWKLSEQATIDREFGAFDQVKDHYPKYVVSMEPFWHDIINGVRHVSIPDFLLMENY